MGAITLGTSGLVFGITAESGVITQTLSRTVTASKVEIADEDGDYCALGFHGFKAEYSIAAVYKTGGTGIAGASVGAQLTLANVSNDHGVTGGTVVVDTVTINKSNTDFTKFDIKATQYPAIT